MPQPENYDGVVGEVPSVRYGHTAVLHQRQMVVTHGYFFSEDRGACFLDDTWALDVDYDDSAGDKHADKPWTLLSSRKPSRHREPGNSSASTMGGNESRYPCIGNSIPPARFHHSSVVHDGGMIMFGGTDGGQRNSRDGSPCSFSFGPVAEMSDIWRFSLDGGKGVQQYSWQKMSAVVSPLQCHQSGRRNLSSEGVGDTSNDSMLESPASSETKIWDEHPRSKRVSLNTIRRHRLESGSSTSSGGRKSQYENSKDREDELSSIDSDYGKRAFDTAFWPEPRAEHGAAIASGRMWVYGGLRGDLTGTADGLEALGDLWSCVISKRIAKKKHLLTKSSPGSIGEPSEFEIRWNCHWQYHGGLDSSPGNDESVVDVGNEQCHFSPEHIRCSRVSPNPVGARYGHACVPGRLTSSGSNNANGFFVVGGRRRCLDYGHGLNRVHGDKSIVNDLWWCDTEMVLQHRTFGDSQGSIDGLIDDVQSNDAFSYGGRELHAAAGQWRRLDTSSSPSWHPRFNFAAAELPHAAGLIIFGGNISTGLKRLPVSAWVMKVRHRQYQGGEGTQSGSGGDITEYSSAKSEPDPPGHFDCHWEELNANVLPDDEGHMQPYGRDHASIVVVPEVNQSRYSSNEPKRASSGSGENTQCAGAAPCLAPWRLLLFGGESTRPYMYHAAVWEVRGANEAMPGR